MDHTNEIRRLSGEIRAIRTANETGSPVSLTAEENGVIVVITPNGRFHNMASEEAANSLQS